MCFARFGGNGCVDEVGGAGRCDGWPLGVPAVIVNDE